MWNKNQQQKQQQQKKQKKQQNKKSKENNNNTSTKNKETTTIIKQQLVFEKFTSTCISIHYIRPQFVLRIIPMPNNKAALLITFQKIQARCFPLFNILRKE